MLHRVGQMMDERGVMILNGTTIYFAPVRVDS